MDWPWSYATLDGRGDERQQGQEGRFLDFLNRPKRWPDETLVALKAREAELAREWQ